MISYNKKKHQAAYKKLFCCYNVSMSSLKKKYSFRNKNCCEMSCSYVNFQFSRLFELKCINKTIITQHVE